MEEISLKTEGTGEGGIWVPVAIRRIDQVFQRTFSSPRARRVKRVCGGGSARARVETGRGGVAHPTSPRFQQVPAPGREMAGEATATSGLFLSQAWLDQAGERWEPA